MKNKHNNGWIMMLLRVTTVKEEAVREADVSSLKKGERTNLKSKLKYWPIYEKLLLPFSAFTGLTTWLFEAFSSPIWKTQNKGGFFKLKYELYFTHTK